MRLLVLWSAPRCRSTAFERMMRERGDFTILHEPFSHLTDYGSTTVDGQVITTEPQLLAALNRTPGPAFLKDTTDFHYQGVLTDREFLGGARHTFIIRHPREAIASHFALNPKLGRDEVGFAWLYEIFAAVLDTTGVTPVVVDSDDLVRDPAGTVERYCDVVGIPFLPDALRWSPGMASGWERSERWHKDTSSSNTFTPRPRRYETSVDNSPLLAEYLAYHLPYYERLREHRLKVG
jgi:hypothetical protein